MTDAEWTTLEALVKAQEERDVALRENERLRGENARLCLERDTARADLDRCMALAEGQL